MAGFGRRGQARAGKGREGWEGGKAPWDSLSEGTVWWGKSSFGPPNLVLKMGNGKPYQPAKKGRGIKKEGLGNKKEGRGN